jgi:hypothetical protein
MNTIKNYNQSEQLREANKMRDLVGAEKIEPYIQNKTAVDQPTIKRLRSIASKIKVD